MEPGDKFTKVLLVFVLSGLLPAVCHCQASACAETSNSSNVVRFDDTGKRVFVHAQTEEIATVRKAESFFKPLQQIVRKCRPSWGNDWSASVFTDAMYAGYKDEPQLQAFVLDGRWSKAYVGEYDRASQKLILNPQDPKKKKWLRVLLP